MSWTDTLATMPELRPMFEPEPGESTAARQGFHVRRAGLGVFAAVYIREPGADARYLTFRAWKADPTGQADFLDSAAGAIVALIRCWSPVLPSDWTVTTPPAGASEGGTYPAGILREKLRPALTSIFRRPCTAKPPSTGTTPRNRSGRSLTPWPLSRPPWFWWSMTSYRPA